MMDNAEIIELARLQLAVDSAPGDELLMKQFEDGLKRLESDPAGYMLLRLAYKLLSRLPYGVSTDNPESERRCLSLAVELGAIVDIKGKGGLYDLRFDPPPIQ